LKQILLLPDIGSCKSCRNHLRQQEQQQIPSLGSSLDKSSS